jgi:hypothetical protein
MVGYTKRGIMALSVALISCTSQQTNQAASTPLGQLFCAIAGPTGQTVTAKMVAAGGDPVAIIATGATAAYVSGVCAAAGGIPVSPPASPGTAPTVAVVPPAAAVTTK